MSKCDGCGFEGHEVVQVSLCPMDVAKLERLLAVTQTLGDSSIELANVRLSTNIQGTPYVVSIDGKGVSGWQRPFGIDGVVKCMLCDQLAEDGTPVCKGCQRAIRAYQLSENKPNKLTDRIVEFFDNSKLYAFFEMAGSAAFEKWIANELSGMEGNPGDPNGGNT